jgi:hypothetical protein
MSLMRKCHSQEENEQAGSQWLQADPLDEKKQNGRK